MDAKYLQAGLTRVDNEHVNVSANTVTFNIADPDRNIPGCNDRDILKFACAMYESVNGDNRINEGPKCVDAIVSGIWWAKAFMHVVRKGVGAREPMKMRRNKRGQ